MMKMFVEITDRMGASHSNKTFGHIHTQTHRYEYTHTHTQQHKHKTQQHTHTHTHTATHTHTHKTPIVLMHSIELHSVAQERAAQLSVQQAHSPATSA